ncbi:MAG: amino acid permease [Simkaniaceae bacterium]|nr:amino acid permease [Simkaniaceae bacterium]
MFNFRRKILDKSRRNCLNLTTTLPPKKKLSIFVLIMMNVSIMASLRNLPLVAEYGYGACFFFVLAGLFFLVPCALVSAELATGWSKSGGIYVWVRDALGDKMGFFAIWMQWAHNLTWFPAILSFVATTLAYVLFPNLETSKPFALIVVLILFWGMTLINYFGIKLSTAFSTIGVIAGSLLPGFVIILLGILWIIGGNPLQIHFADTKFIPDLNNFDQLAFLAGLFLAFSGLEVSAGFAGEVKNPQKNYPRAILISALIAFTIFLLGSFAISFIIPESEISLVSGLMQTLVALFKQFHISWLLPIFGILLIFGALAEGNAWIFGPVKALHMTAIHGNLPPKLQILNKYGMPKNILFFQAIIVSVFACIILYTPSLSASYWILSALSAQMYLLMYILMFISAIVLRYKKPHVPRTYRIPHPHKGIWIVSCIGILASLFGIFIAFFPPSQIQIGNIYLFEALMVGGLLLMVALPLTIYALKKDSWNPLLKTPK